MPTELVRSLVPTRLVRSVVRWARPPLVNHRLTDEAVVQALRRASGVAAVAAVYDDGAAAHATPETLERELDVTCSAERALALPSVSRRSFVGGRRPVRAVALTDADPPVVLLSRRSLAGWDDEARDFVLGHEFGHLLAEADGPTGGVDAAAVARHLLPAPERSALAIRALVAAHREFRAGEAHAEIRRDLPARHRPSPSVAAAYHEAERASTDSVVLSAAERRALAIRNAAKYLALPYDPPGIEEEVRDALALPLHRYLDWVREWTPEKRSSA